VEEEDTDSREPLLGYSTLRGESESPASTQHEEDDSWERDAGEADGDDGGCGEGEGEGAAGKLEKGVLYRAGARIVVYRCSSFTGSRTWDGIDVNAHRAAEEVSAEAGD
jgi:hypothetical protein